jgi:hypothetical protein
MDNYTGTRWLSRCCLGLLAGLMALGAADSAVGQGFMVQPMGMEVTARAGQSIEVPLKIRNLAGGQAGAVDLRLVELSQGEQGSWRDIEPDSGVDTSGLSSSLAWSSLSDNRAQIAPFEPAEVMLQLRVPPSARGSYFAAIIVETPGTEGATGLELRVRFLVPVFIEIDGRPVRQRVELDDVEMVYRDQASQPTTTAHLRVANRGKTFSRVRGELRIERENEGRWRPVTRVDIAERAIIPGITLELGGDLKRRLPSGTYRLRAELHVDGRRIAPLEKEITFEGDPDIDTLAYDTALMLTPEMVRMDVVPGATRTTALSIENPGDDPVTVRMAASTPRGLIGVEMGDLQGSALSAEPWTEIRPAQFTIRAGGRQNVRVMSRVPREGVQHANYYADMVLQGTYEDGQSAGETRSTVQLFNASLESEIDGDIEQLLLAEGDEPLRYIVQMRFANLGTVHLQPTARVVLLTPHGSGLRDVALAGEEGALLPLGKRSYGGEMDFSDIEPGYYALRSRITLTHERTITQQLILLVESEEAKTAAGATTSVTRITVVDPDIHDVPDGLDEPGDEPAPIGENPAGTEADNDEQDDLRS